MATLRGTHKWIMLIVVLPAFFGLCASDDGEFEIIIVTILQEDCNLNVYYFKIEAL